MKLEKREYICDICKQIFLRRRYFVQHFRRHNQHYDDANSSVNLMKFLPKNWKYIVKSYKPHTQKNNFSAIVLAAGLSTTDHIKEWMKEFMNLNKCNYILKYLDSRESRFAKSKHVYACRYLSRKSNKFSCQSCVRFTVRRNWEDSAYFGTIHIKFIHNHSPDCAALLRYRTPSEEVQKYFRSMFDNGFSPSQAYNSYKQHLYVQYNDNYDKAISDRALNPDQRWVYYFYQKLLKEKHGPTAAEQMITTIRTSVNEFNERHEQNYCHYAQVDENNFAIVVLTPLMTRALRLAAVNEVLYVDYESQVSRFGLHVYLLFVGCCVGGIPIGVVITSDDHESVILKGFQYYCSLVDAPANPRILVVVDSSPLRKALRTLFPNACLLLNAFQILEAGWKWLWRLENAIDARYRKTFYNYLQRMVYCGQPQQLDAMYGELQRDTNVQKFRNFVEYARNLYERRAEWSACVQQQLHNVEHQHKYAQNAVENCVKIFKEKIFKKLKSHNPAQLFYYIVGDFNTYYERKLYDAAVNDNQQRSRQPSSFAIDQQELAKYKLEYIAESVVMLTNTKKNLHYIVNEEIGVCSCYLGEVGLTCKHLMMANHHRPKVLDESVNAIGEEERRQLYYVAEGTNNLNRNMAENHVILMSDDGNEEIPMARVDGTSDDDVGTTADEETGTGLDYTNRVSDAMKEEEIVLILNGDDDGGEDDVVAANSTNNSTDSLVVTNEVQMQSPQMSHVERHPLKPSTFDEFEQLLEKLTQRVKNNSTFEAGVRTMNGRLKELLRFSDDRLKAAMMNFSKNDDGNASNS